jgi:hypothetical protein
VLFIFSIFLGDHLTLPHLLTSLATAGVVKPRPIDEFARTIEPEVRKGMYEGILDVLPA